MSRSFYNKSDREKLLSRLEALSPDSRAQWGRMNAAQMLLHCTAAMKVPVGDLILKKTWMRIIGRWVKKSSLADKPWRKNLPTAPEFIFSKPCEFAASKQQFLDAFHKLAKGAEVVKVYDHPFFGAMTLEEWGLLTHKHLDHHFQQFGV